MQIPTRFRHVLVITTVILSCTLAPARGVIGLVTDFGLGNEAVGLCKGAIAAVNSDLLTIDITHNIESYSITHAALVLRRTTGFPKGTVFVCVVDPGVGTSRRAIALQTKLGYIFVGPDNGVFSLISREQGIASAIELDPKRVNSAWRPGTFDGRDLFSLAAAVIATSGTLTSAGNVIDSASIVMVDIPTATWHPDQKELRGQYLRTDEPYGNVWTNITSDHLTSAGIKQGNLVDVSIGKYELNLPLVLTFGQVSQGEPLAYLGSDGSFALAVNMGDFRKSYSVDPGTTLSVRLAK